MRLARGSIIFYFLLFGLMAGISVNTPLETIPSSDRSSMSSYKITINQQFTPHAPISIRSNADFAAQGFSGSGTESDPYRIENLNITVTSHDQEKNRRRI